MCEIPASIDERDSSSSLNPWTNHRFGYPRNDHCISSVAARDHQHHGEVSCSCVEACRSNDEAYDRYCHWQHNVERRIAQAICRVVVQDRESDTNGVRRYCEQERRDSSKSKGVHDSRLWDGRLYISKKHRARERGVVRERLRRNFGPK